MDLKPGEYYEDCFYHPCLCVRVDTEHGQVEGISLVDGTYPRACSIGYCGIRKLTLAEALDWKFNGPKDVPEDAALPVEKRWWEPGGW